MDKKISLVDGKQVLVPCQTDVNGYSTIATDLSKFGGKIHEVDYFKGNSLDPRVLQANALVGQLRMIEHIDQVYELDAKDQEKPRLIDKSRKEQMVNLMINGLQAPGVFPVTLLEPYKSYWNPGPSPVVMVDKSNAEILLKYDMLHFKFMSRYYMVRNVNQPDQYASNSYIKVSTPVTKYPCPRMIWESNATSGLAYTTQMFDKDPETGFSIVPTLRELCLRTMFSSWNCACGQDKFGAKVFDGTNNLYESLEASVAKMFRPQILPNAHWTRTLPDGSKLAEKIFEPGYVTIAMKWFAQLNDKNKCYPPKSFGNEASIKCHIECVDIDQVRLPNKDVGLIFNAKDPTNVDIKIPMPDYDLIQVVRGKKKLFKKGLRNWVKTLLSKCNRLISDNGGKVPSNTDELSDFVWKLSPKHEKHFWTDDLATTAEDRASLRKKLRLFFIPCGMAYIIAFITQKNRMMYERGHFIQVGLKWLDGGSQHFYNLMGGDCKNSIYYEGDFSKFDLSILPNFLTLYTLYAQMYKTPEAYEGSNYQMMLEHYACQLTGKIMRYFSGNWRMIIGQMPSGDFNTSHGDSWIHIIVWLSFIVHLTYKFPELKDPIISWLQTDQLFNAVFGDDWLMRIPKYLENFLTQWMMKERKDLQPGLGYYYAWWVKAVFDMEIKAKSLKKYESLLSVPDQTSGMLLKKGPKFLKMHLIKVNYGGKDIVVTYRPVIDYYSRIFHFVEGNYDDVAILCKIIGLWWNNISNDCASIFLYYCWEKITKRIFDRKREADLPQLLSEAFRKHPERYDKYLRRMGVSEFVPELTPATELRKRWIYRPEEHRRRNYVNVTDY